VVNRHTFHSLGGFDDGMFVGFEDIDFSIRLFRAGQKVGNCGVMALVHDHQAPQNDHDRGYEKRRFSSAVIEKSARHLEAKYGFTVWSDAVTEWLKASQKRMGVDGGDRSAAAPATAPRTATPGALPSPAEAARKPRIALIVDVQDWAYGNIARQLMRRLGSHFEFRFLPMDVIDNPARALMLAEDCDVLHFFWRETLGILSTDYVSSYLGWGGVDYEPWKNRFVLQKAISTAVYDHLFLDDAARKQRLPLFQQADAYYVSSGKLKAIYDGIAEYGKPAAVLPDGVDRDMFFPRRHERLQACGNRELVVGWVGNSAWSADVEDFKGVHTILKPALAQLQQAGHRLRAHFADRRTGFIPHAEMVDYYAEIDVLVCTSKIEGTPNPVLEAMACGVPVVSTDVGIVRDALGPLQREFVLAQRDVPCLVRALQRLLDEPALLPRLGDENLAAVVDWGWDVKALPFVDYFRTCLARRDARLRPAPVAGGSA
jgi:glycosyltransferase involved in cell wall biosynthesis